MRHYSLTDLALFSAIADELNLTKGAAKVHLAPSSASLRIQNLEDALGIALLKRKVRGVELTQAGEIVNRAAKEIDARLGVMENALAPLINLNRGVIRIVANYGASADCLPEDIASYLVKRPDVQISLEQTNSQHVVEVVAQGDADIGVGAYVGNYSGVTFLPYRTDKLVILCRREHPLAAFDVIDFRDCLQYDFVALTNKSAMQCFIFQKAQELGHSIEPRIQVDNQQILVDLVRAGAGIGVVSKSAFTSVHDTELKSVELNDVWAVRNLRIAVTESILRKEGAVSEMIAFLTENQSSRLVD